MSDFPKNSRIRIRTVVAEGQRARGVDTKVVLVHSDGTEEMLPDIVNAHWWVSARGGYCTAVLTCHCEIDAEALAKDITLVNVGSPSQMISVLEDQRVELAALEMELHRVKGELHQKLRELDQFYEDMNP